ncbi:MAG: hypothetical protein ACREHD_03825 [Pirellulales bacterium]
MSVQGCVEQRGLSHGDDWSMYTGYQDDICRCGYRPPTPDFVTVPDTCRFGGPHPTVWNAAFCDGRVRGLSFDIDPKVHRLLANRADQKPIDDALLGP